MIYIKRFYESVDIDNVDYKKEITEKDFFYLLDKHCKNFNPNDRSLIRGDKNLHENFYYVNGNNRKIDYGRGYPFHLIFMGSELWDGLPKKSKSMDFMLSGGNFNAGHYGNVYRVIPFDDAKFVSHYNLIGNDNEVLSNDIGVWSILNLNKDLKKFHDTNYGESVVNINMVNNLNELFKDKKKVLEYSKSSIFVDSDYIKRLYYILIKRNMEFKEYMEYAFGPESYNVCSYQELLNTNGVGWTDSLVLLIKYDYSKTLFNDIKQRNRISNNYTKEDLDMIIRKYIRVDSKNFGKIMGTIKMNNLDIGRDDMRYISNKLKKLIKK